MEKNKKSSSGLSRKGLIIWISLTFFASAWMFVLGIIVGRGTSPVKFDIEKLQKELALLRETGIMKEIRKYKIDTGADQHKTEMGFYERLKDTEKDVRLNTDEHKPPDRSFTEKTDQETKQTVKAKQTKPPETPVDSNAAAVAANLSAKGLLTIQIASLRDPKAADIMVAELKKMGFPAYRRTAEIAGKGTWYRVRVGHYASKAEANRMLDKLSKSQVKGIVVER